MLTGSSSFPFNSPGGIPTAPTVGWPFKPDPNILGTEKLQSEYDSWKLQAEEILRRGNSSREKKTCFKYKGVRFFTLLPEEALQFFESDTITKDEIRLFEMTFPDLYARLKRDWISAWTQYQGNLAFEND